MLAVAVVTPESGGEARPWAPGGRRGGRRRSGRGRGRQEPSLPWPELSDVVCSRTNPAPLGLSTRETGHRRSFDKKRAEYVIEFMSKGYIYNLKCKD